MSFLKKKMKINIKNGYFFWLTSKTLCLAKDQR